MAPVLSYCQRIPICPIKKEANQQQADPQPSPSQYSILRDLLSVQLTLQTQNGDHDQATAHADQHEEKEHSDRPGVHISQEYVQQDPLREVEDLPSAPLEAQQD